MENTSQAFQRVLGEYRRRLASEEAYQRSLTVKSDMVKVRDTLLLPVGEDIAQLCVDLIVARNAKVIVELGSSYGYSTLYLAEAARRTGGRLYSYEIHPAKQQHARERIEAAELGAQVEWRLGDAVKLLADQPGPIDFVLLDLWKDLYIPCLDVFHPKLAPNGLIVADNMLYPEFNRPDGAAYRAAVRAKPEMEAVLLPIGQGIDLACRSNRPQ
ncbi:MAG TPA: class I SAM-dependent methyltransferase [Steroidobacteraceae bacterium]|nr:class I SAM-dependent methyltransferase [Steroidobacteraceae bacterium]